MVRGSSLQSPGRRVFTIFLVYCIVSLFCDAYFCPLPGPTWYISYSCGTIKPICGEIAVKNQLTNVEFAAGDYVVDRKITRKWKNCGEKLKSRLTRVSCRLTVWWSRTFTVMRQCRSTTNDCSISLTCMIRYTRWCQLLTSSCWFRCLCRRFYFNVSFLSCWWKSTVMQFVLSSRGIQF